MLKRLASERLALVVYQKHWGVRLTSAGKRRAWELVGHHRLLELFLHDVLKYSWDEVHKEAERLEHFISERFEDRVAAILGDPEIDRMDTSFRRNTVVACTGTKCRWHEGPCRRRPPSAAFPIAIQRLSVNWNSSV